MKAARMFSNIDKFVVEECKESVYVRPFRLSFVQNNTPRKWDLIKSHDSVAILVHHVERNSLLFVRQFRPAVFFNRVAGIMDLGSSVPPPGTEITGDPKLGLTVELCAGIVDKTKPLAQIALEELKEEMGFTVPESNLERILSLRTGIGITGTEQTIYYVRVTEAMRSTTGGGNIEEGEYIETVEVPIAKARDFIFDESHVKPPGCVFAIMWFLKERHSPSLSEAIHRHGYEITVLSAGISIAAMSIAYAISRLLK